MWEKIYVKKDPVKTIVRYKNDFESRLSLSNIAESNFRVISVNFHLFDKEKDHHLSEYLQELDIKYCKLLNQTDIPNQLECSIIADPNNILQNKEFSHIVEEMQKYDILPNDTTYQFLCFQEEPKTKGLGR